MPGAASLPVGAEHAYGAEQANFTSGRSCAGRTPRKDRFIGEGVTAVKVL